MKNYKLLPTAIIGILLLTGLNTTNKTADRNEKANISFIENQPIEGKVTKAIMYDGNVIPSVELPTVVISTERNTTFLQKAIVVDGKVYPSVELNEVVIRPNL